MDLTLKASRDAFGDAIIDIAEKDFKVIALTADLADSLRLVKFSQIFPERFFDIGVAEQNMMGIAAGLALDGMIPYVASFAVFNPGRNWDQIRVSVAYNNANVKIIGGYVGFSNGKDGATHQALEDIALMRVLPHMVVIDTADYDQTYNAIHKMHEYLGPAYIRIRRDPIMGLKALINSFIEKKSKGYEKLDREIASYFEIGKGYTLKKGTDITIIASGAMVHKAIEASMLLEQDNIDVEVINMSSIKPLDSELILNSAQKTRCILTVEEHQRIGGLGSAVSELISQNYPIFMKIMGVDDQFGETGTQEELLVSKGLTTENIILNVKETLRYKNSANTSTTTSFS